MDYIHKPENVQKAQKYIDIALDMGATDAVLFEIDQICFDSRTLLKCMYGCEDWGKNHTCPSRPGNPSMSELKEMFSRYKWGVIVHTQVIRLPPRPTDFPARISSFSPDISFSRRN